MFNWYTIMGIIGVIALVIVIIVLSLGIYQFATGGRKFLRFPVWWSPRIYEEVWGDSSSDKPREE